MTRKQTQGECPSLFNNWCLMNNTHGYTVFCKHSHQFIVFWWFLSVKVANILAQGEEEVCQVILILMNKFVLHLKINGLKPYELQTFFTPKNHVQNCKYLWKFKISSITLTLCSVVIATTVARFRLILMNATQVESASCQPFSAGRFSLAVFEQFGIVPKYSNNVGKILVRLKKKGPNLILV